MEKLEYSIAAETDIAFISRVYDENIESLHGAPRSGEIWKKLLSVPEHTYYIVKKETPVAWFRTDEEDGAFWLGMLQVTPGARLVPGHGAIPGFWMLWRFWATALT